MKLAGLGVSAGRGCAPPYLFASDPWEADVLAGGAADASSLDALARALEGACAELVEVEQETARRLGEEHAAIFQAHRLILEDEEWLEPVRARIGGGESPAAAIWRTSEELAEELGQLDDPYLRGRAVDVLDVAKRVLAQLGCLVRPKLPGRGDGEVILVARELTPSDTIGLDPALVRGIATETGTRTSHAAILARQLGIPAVVAVPGLVAAARESRLVAIDGEAGTCELDPEAVVEQAHRAAAAASAPVVRARVRTADRVAVTVAANASSAEEVADAVARGADEIGLYRTEFLFLRNGELPDEEAQVAAYSAAAEVADGRPIVFRTLDVGADKDVPGIELPPEQNPFLGVRGIRLSLQQRELFAIQLRALVRTSRLYPNVRVMLPMVSDPSEVRAVLDVLVELGGPDALCLGAMLEVPSAAILVREIAQVARFLSVGTNDLTSYVLAADRMNPRLGHLYDELHPAVLRVLRMIAVGAEETATPLSVCGEIAGDPRAAAVLVGLGFRSLSVAPPLVPRIKAAVRATSERDASELARRLLSAADAAEVREALAHVPAGVA